MAKIIKCPFCDKRYSLIDALYAHMERDHRESLDGLPPQQVIFNYRNKYPLNKEFGKSVISGKPTPFNMTTGRYERFANDNERNQYREYFRNNMIRKYGKDTILDEPEQQKTMLANRKISGVYKWSDGVHETTYTGSYEEKFLEFLDLSIGWDNPDDIMAPAPMIFRYEYEGKNHFHIPDFYISSCNLIVNIKSDSNKHYRLRDIDIEYKQDESIKKSKFNYIKIMDNNFTPFINMLDKIRDIPDNTPQKALVMGVR